MHPARLLRIAEHEVRRTMAALPPAIRAGASECRVDCMLMSEALAEGEEFDEELLGLFEGCSRADAPVESVEALPYIRLFVDNIWDYAGGSVSVFRAEVRLTLLHELGHYLGLDEAGVERLGLA